MAPTFPSYSITIGTKGTALNPQAVKDMVDLTSGHPERIALRWQVPMSLIVKSGGQYDWTLYDDAVKKCNDGGIAVYLTIKKFPSSGQPTPSEATTFGMAIAARYGNKIAAIEIGNEDFSYDEFGLLADAMNAAYSKIKAINPSLLVLPGSTLQRNSANMKAAVATLLQRAGSSIDGVNIHTYFGIPSTGPSVPQDGSKPNVPSFPQYVQNIKDISQSQGYPNMGIYVTEYGFSCTSVNHSNVPIFSEADQWKHMKYCLDQAREMGVRHMSWFTLGYANPPDGMSLVQAGGRKTIAYNGFKDYIEQYPALGAPTPTPEPEPTPDPDPTPAPTGPTPEQIAAALLQLDQAAIHRRAADAALKTAEECLDKAVALLRPTPSQS